MEIEIGKSVVEYLRMNSYADDAQQLEEKLLLLNSDDESEIKKAAKDIISRCDPRWLGDSYIKELALNEWLNKLNKLKKFAKRKM